MIGLELKIVNTSNSLKCTQIKIEQVIMYKIIIVNYKYNAVRKLNVSFSFVGFFVLFRLMVLFFKSIHCH